MKSPSKAHTAGQITDLLTAQFHRLKQHPRTEGSLWVLLAMLPFVVLSYAWWQALPDRLFCDPTSTVLEDRAGSLLGAQIATDGQWRFPHNAEVPDKFEAAIIQFEDRDFYRHGGFSPKAFARAMVQNVKAKRVVSGGSTISMQVIRLMRKGQGRTVFEKLIEVVWATRLELRLSKQEILAHYASNAPFGGNVVGLDAASWRYFGRSADQLSWSESATLAVLPNAPSLIYPGKNQQRLLDKRNRVLDRLYAIGEIDSVSWTLARMEPLPQKPHALPQSAPHLLERAKREGRKGQRLQTTISRPIQAAANRLVDLHLNRLKENEIHNAAVLVLSIDSGEVLAYVGNGGNGYGVHGNAVDVIRAPRSTGSILKPFLYAAMLDGGAMTPDQLVPDVPTNYGGYSPKNFNGDFAGAIPARKALAKSLNIPAVRMLSDYGVERFHHQLTSWGMTTLNQPAKHYGLSLILGGAEAKLWDLASMYALFGRTLKQYPAYDASLYAPVTYLPREVQKSTTGNAQLNPVVEPPLDPAALFFTLEAMVDVTRPNADFNWKVFDSGNKVAWKTGTSFGFRDAWAIGLTKDHVVAVWIGNADGEGRPGLIGSQAAAPLLFDLFDYLPAQGWFDPPYDEMSQIPVCSRSGFRASAVCDVVDTVYMPNTCLRTASCPYHQLVHLDASGKHRVDSDCESVTTMTHESWFVLPPLMEWYYRYKDPRYRVLPPFRSDCSTGSEEEAMSLIYPKKDSRIYVPTELDGSKGKTVFEATHRDPATEVYWHLDEQFLGSTSEVHQLAVRPAPGKHTLTLMDERGTVLTRHFEVIGKADQLATQ